VILASSSRYRRALLARIISDFVTEPPAVSEEVLAGEAPAGLAARLARAKAADVAARRKGIIIGSDQVAEVGGRALGKPGSRERATEQLLACSGRTLALHTAVCVIDTRTGTSQSHISTADMHYRELTREMAVRYVEHDDPVDCAGSFKFESRGVALFERVRTDDPTAIEGLPLLWLSSCLQALGVPVL
jgi:septum formation protein